MQIIKYPDGSSYVQERNPTGFITFKINNYEDLWHLNQYVDAYNNFNKGGMRPTITIPCLLDAQADRRFNIGESSGLKLVCQFLNNMNADFKIFHPHNPEVVEALMDNVEIIDNSKFIKDILNKMSISLNEKSKADSMNGNREKAFRYNLEKRLILMSSDAGSFKPLMKLCDKIGWQGETYSASKARLTGHSEPRLVQKIDKEDFGGKDILIADDVCVYGSTFKGLSTMLKERNCGKLYLAVSHMTVQDLGEDPVTNYFDTVFTTNSKYDKYFSRHVYYKTVSPNGGDLLVGGDDNVPNLEIIKLF